MFEQYKELAETIIGNGVESYYSVRKIRKPKGGWRVITEPQEPLMTLQTQINETLQQIPVHPCAHGFVTNRSIKTNAEVHMNRSWVLGLDVKNFFPSIHKDLLLEIPVPEFIAGVCLFQGGLPQGAPTSPTLSNLIMREVDELIFQACRTVDIGYTRYADDITLSCGSQSQRDLLVVSKFIEEVISKLGLKVNEKKTKLAPYYQRQKITGVVVNQQLSTPRTYRMNLRAKLYQMKQKGLPLDDVTRGELEYVRSINQQQYDKLMSI